MLKKRKLESMRSIESGLNSQLHNMHKQIQSSNGSNFTKLKHNESRSRKKQSMNHDNISFFDKMNLASKKSNYNDRFSHKFVGMIDESSANKRKYSNNDLDYLFHDQSKKNKTMMQSFQIPGTQSKIEARSLPPQNP